MVKRAPASALSAHKSEAQRTTNAGKARTEVYGIEAGRYARKAYEDPDHPAEVKFRSGFFQEAPIVSLTIEGNYGLASNENIQESSVGTGGFKAVTTNTGPYAYRVHWIAFGVIGYTDVAGSAQKGSTRKKR
jgi:hypothetical protein